MATERLRPFTPAWCQVGGNPNYHPALINNYVNYPTPKVSNFTQTTEDDGAPYSSFCWRDGPKAFQAKGTFLTQYHSASFYFVFSDDTPGPGEDFYCDKIVTVTEASNGHQYFLGQTVTANFMQGDEPFEVSHTFTSADWATTPEYDPYTGLGYIANPSGPSTYIKRYYDVYVIGTYDTGGTLPVEYEDTIYKGTPESFFQPPGG